MKTCSTCKVPKDESEFRKDRNTTSGLSSACRSCLNKKGEDGLSNTQRSNKRIGADGLTNQQRNKKKIGKDGLTNSQRWEKNNPDKLKNKHYKSAYGITLVEYSRMLEEQSGCCAICNRPPTEKKLSVDHCHRTGKVRGLLCQQCNAGIGMLGDRGEFLIKAAQYLGYSYGAGILSGDTLRRLKPVEPFIERTVIHGLSAGVSVAGYDIRIREGLTLKPGDFSLASTVEKFSIPNNVMAWVKDKSTWARQGLSVFNTCAEPGWKGVLTLELKHLGDKTLTIKSGSPIAQVIFAFTDFPTSGYGNGKYQDAPPGITPALFEKP